jgi:hypothetical protein
VKELTESILEIAVALNGDDIERSTFHTLFGRDANYRKAMDRAANQVAATRDFTMVSAWTSFAASSEEVQCLMTGSLSNIARKLPETVQGDAGLVQAAITKTTAVQRACAVMREMLADNRDRYAWTLDDWASTLSTSRKTVLKTDAWHDILAFRGGSKVP